MANSTEGRSEDETSGDSSKGSDIETLRIAREMGRSVIDHQIEGLNTLNDKASNTIRINILILGVVLTIFSIVINGGDSTGVSPASIVNGATGTGVLLSGVSIITALWTYTSTRKEVGLNAPSLLKSIGDEHDYSEHAWLKGTIRAQSGWIKKNAKVNRNESFILFFSHLFLFMSLGFYTFGVLWGVTNPGGSLLLYSMWVVILSFLLPILVIMPRYWSSDLVPESISARVEKAFESMMDND